MDAPLPIVADESVDYAVLTFLRDQGFSIYAILEERPSISDYEVLALANDKGALLLTEDKDFGELSIRLQKPHRGILLIRLTGVAAEEKCRLVHKALIENSNQLADAFSVLSDQKLRIRPSKTPRE